jgi:hypothetical protein
MATSGEFFGAPGQLAAQAAGKSPSTPLTVSGLTGLPQTAPVDALLAPTSADQLTINSILGLLPDATVVDALIPSPFTGLNASTYPAAGETQLNLVDGGNAGENVPFFPLLGSARKVDVIIAIDASADTNNFPDGQEPRHTCKLFPSLAKVGSAYSTAI